MTRVREEAGIVVLSRFSSQRLPGKALERIGGVPLLGRILLRLRLGLPEMPIVVATSEEHADNAIANLCKEYNVSCFRGDLENVAQRFLQAAESLGLKYAVRITGDSLYMDPRVIKIVLEKASGGKYVLTSNRIHQTYPIGQTVEVVDIHEYRTIYPQFNQKSDFEHVTDFFYRYADRFERSVFHVRNPDGKHREISMAIDTPGDLELARKVYLVIGEKIATEPYMRIYQLMKDCSNG